MRISPHLVRGPLERTDDAVQQFYERLLAVLRDSTVRDGEWRLVECVPAWDGNWTWDCCLAWTWTAKTDERRLVAVNYAGNQSQCYVRLPLPDGSGSRVRFHDLTGTSRFDKERGDLAARGLGLDMPSWGYHVFEVSEL